MYALPACNAHVICVHAHPVERSMPTMTGIASLISAGTLQDSARGDTVNMVQQAKAGATSSSLLLGTEFH